MLLLPYQVLTTNGWLDASSIFAERVATVDPMTMHMRYETPTGYYTVRCNYRVQSYGHAYALLRASEGTRLLAAVPRMAGSGASAPELTPEWFETASPEQLRLCLQSHGVREQRTTPCDITTVDKMQQVCLHLGLPSTIRYSDSIMELPKLSVGFDEPSTPLSLDMDASQPWASTFTNSTGWTVVRTLYNNQWSVFVVSL